MQLRSFFLRKLYWPALLSLLLGGGVWFGVRQATQLLERQTMLQKQLERVQGVLSEVLNLETGVRGYLLTADLAFLEPYREARGQVLGDLDTLEAGLSGTNRALEGARLEEVRGLLARWFAEVAEVQISQVILEGRRGTGNDAVSRKGKALIDAIRVRLGAYRQAEERTQAALERQQRQTLEGVGALVGLSLLAATIAALLVSLRVAGQLSSVFSRLEGAVRRLAEGRIEAVPPSPLLEVNSLSQSFNWMSRQLLESRRLLEHSNHNLERSAHFERTLSEILELYTLDRRIEDIATRLLEVIAERHGLDYGAAYGFLAHDKQLHLRGEFQLQERLPENLNPQDELLARVLSEQKAIWLEDADLAALHSDAEQGRHTAVLPILREAQVFGVVFLKFSAPFDSFDALLDVFLNNLTLQLGLASAKLSAEIQRQQLSAQIQAHSTEIESKNQALERSDRLKTEFLANMSHELRTPLNAVLGFSDLLEEQFFGPLNERQVGYVREISQAGGHLLGLINDVLDLSKIEAGVVVLERGALVLPPLLESCVSMVRERAHAKNIRLETALDALLETRSVWADERKFKQVLVNLLSNAVKFTLEGGRVRLEAKIQRQDDSESLYLAVVDSGIGIALEDQDKLFQSFTQVDGSLSRRHEGTGLGLALVRSLVSLHGGEVGVVSAPGEGSTFWLTLPQRSERKEVVEPPEIKPDSVLGSGSDRSSLESAQPELTQPELTQPGPSQPITAQPTSVHPNSAGPGALNYAEDSA